MKKFIAERKVFFSPKGIEAKKNELIIRIGIPYCDEMGIAKCPVEWDGLFESFADIGGMDKIQALHLATDIDSMLEKLCDKYDFYWDTGEPYFEG